MTAAEQADRNARNILELVQARRQIAALVVYRDALAESSLLLTPLDVVYELDLILATQPAPTSSHPEEVSA